MRKTGGREGRSRRGNGIKLERDKKKGRQEEEKDKGEKEKGEKGKK